MAKTQRFRPNGAIKQYQIIEDFSGGMNTKEEDSLLTDNVAREVTNFNIQKGGVLNKRPGFHALDLVSLVATALNIEESVINNFDIVNSWNFISYNRNVISLVTRDGYVISFIFTEGQDEPVISHNKFDTNDIVFQKYGEQAFIILRQQDQTESFFTNEIYIWDTDKWVQSTPEDDIDVSIITNPIPNSVDVNGTGNALARFQRISGVVGQTYERIITAFRTGGQGNLNGDDFSFTENVSDIFDFTDTINSLINDVPNNAVLDVSQCNINITLTFEFNGITRTETIQYTVVPAGKYFTNSLIQILRRLEENGIQSTTLTSNGANKVVIYNIGNTNVVVYDDNNNSSALFKTTDNLDLDAKSIVWFTGNANGFGISEVFNVFGVDTTGSAVNPYQGDTYESISFEVSANSTNSQLNFKYNLTASSFDKTIPDAFSLTNLSYNLLTLKSNDEVETFITPNPDYLKFDVDSEAPNLTGIMLLNGYFPTIDVPGSYKASLDLPIGEDRKQWEMGFQALPLTTFTTINASVESVQQYLENVVIPTFQSQKNVNGEFTFTPRTTDAYVLFAVARKAYDADGNYIDPSAITNLSDVLLTERNVIPVESNSKLNSVDIIGKFYGSDKSIAWKNQMFLFGNSNTFFVSRVNDFGYFPMLYNFQVPSDSSIVAIVAFNDSLLITTETQQFVLSGNSPADFAIKPLNDDIGAIAPKAVKNNLNEVFQLTQGGVYKVKTTFNFNDRFNIEKVDDFIYGQIAIDRNAVALVINDQYLIHTPSDNTIWTYYNSYKAWVKFTSPLLDLQNMYRINETLTLIGKKGINIFRYGNDWVDRDTLGNVYEINSVYTSKEIDWGLQNHDKKIKKLQVRLANTDQLTELFITVDVDNSNVVNPDKTQVRIDETGKIIYETITEAQIVNQPRGVFDADGVDYDASNYVSDSDQLHELVVSGRGRNTQFKVEHKDNAAMNIKNFGVILKLKKPKAIRTTATREARLINT